MIERIKEKFKDAIIGAHFFRNDETVIIKKEKLVDVIEFLRTDEELLYNFLTDLTIVDLGVDKNPRFEVVYHLYSLNFNRRIRIKVPVDENESVDSLTGFYKIANWYEREAWDMFGIRFNGHPDLKRILLYEEFQGHPLRKDYPIDKEQPLVKYEK